MDEQTLVIDLDQRTIRPIHYLGSKLRVLNQISDAIESVGCGGRVCDLFSGSGTVSYHLAKKWPVTSVDIQEYSRVICSAINQKKDNLLDISIVVSEVKGSKLLECLNYCYEPLISYEEMALKKAHDGNPLPVCEIVEFGSLHSKLYKYNNIQIEYKQVLKEVESRLREKKIDKSPVSIISRYYGGIYFSYKQAVQLDSILDVVFKNKSNKDYLLAILLSTTSEIVNTVGKHFAQPINPRKKDGSPKKNIVKRIEKDREVSVIDTFSKWGGVYNSIAPSNFDNKAYRMDYMDALKALTFEGVEVIYADPPYTRDHYSRYYHVLETMCLRDNPLISKSCLGGGNIPSKGAYRIDRHQSPFSIKSRAPEAFHNLFKGAKSIGAKMVLSYSPYVDSESRPRLLTISQIQSIASKYYKRVETVGVNGIAHSKFNVSSLNYDKPDEAEVLMLCA